jgi:hypothetical protein
LAVFFLIGPACIAGGCSKSAYFADAETALKTSGYYHVLDHISSYYPSGISLNFPGYLVGFEESANQLVTLGREDLTLDESMAAESYTIERLIGQMKYDLPYISQVMHYQGRPYGEGNCALYNLYHSYEVGVVDFCDDELRGRVVEKPDHRLTYLRSWEAIEILKERLNQDVATNEYTHLIVAVMGLDTPQEDAVRNYNSIVASIRRKAGSSFRPLFVGVTWPSFFANRWFDPLWEVLAYPPIADRADIHGLSWLGVLLHQAIMPLGERIEISVIAHSFGARAASMAICVGPAILRPDKQPVKAQSRSKVDNFIGLASAFTLKRFEKHDNVFYEDVYYRDFCPSVKRFIFSASSNDHAFTPVFWSSPVGDHDVMLEYCGRQQPVSVSCVPVTDQGEIIGHDPSAKVLYLDTSRLMKYTMPGTKGGGHSDIYRPEVGVLLWSLLSGSTQ